MNCGLGCHSTARIGIKQSLPHAYQVWCPHVAQAPRAVAKQAQATSLAAPSYAPGVDLQTDAAGPADATSAGGGSGASAISLHVGIRTADRSDPGTRTCEAVGASVLAATSGPCRGPAASLNCQQPGPEESSNDSVLMHTRPPADRTAEASTSASSAGLSRYNSNCSSSSGRRNTGRNSSTVGSGAAAAGASSGASSTSNGRQHFRRAARHGHRGHSTSGGDNSESADGAGSTDVAKTSAAAAATPIIAATGGGGGRQAAGRPQQSGDGGGAAAASAAPPRPPLTLERLREQHDELRPLALEVLHHRLAALSGLLQLDQTAALHLCRVVPGLLLAEPSALQRSWGRLCVSLGGEEPARSAAAAAPLLLVLPSDRVPAAVAALAAATALPRAAAASLVAEWPQLATHAPASLAAKLEGLRRLLGPGGPGPEVPGGGGSAGAAAAPAPPAALRAALRAAPRLLTFSTTALARHHAELAELFGSPEALRAALSREPGLLLQRPATVAAKLALLRQGMDCGDQPAAVAALVVRCPGLLRRSLAALAAGCRALSIWQFRRREKLRMVISRPGLLALPPAEVHGRCRWLRRLMLSNAYYHAALRRLPPSLVGAVVAALPRCWSRLQYLAESSQECRMCIMDVVECRQEDFCARFPEFERWQQFKTKLMGAENPWRGTHRIRGFNEVRDKPTHGAPNQVNLMQRQQRQRAARRPHQRQQQHAAGPSVPVVLAEACEVRSGGSTVSRPRWVLRQPMTAGAAPMSAAAAPAAQLLSEGHVAAPAMLILPPVGVEVTPPPPPLPSPVQVRKQRSFATGRDASSLSSSLPAPAAAAVAAAAAAAAELPR